MSSNHTSRELLVARSHELLASNPESGLTRRIGAHNGQLMLVEHRMEKGWAGARHSHPHEQIVYVVRGRIQATLGDISFEAAAGDSFVVRGGVEHQASALEDSLVIDVFTPCRGDYL
jgi:quercetin dioxygenase-like cupin family protein